MNVDIEEYRRLLNVISRVEKYDLNDIKLFFNDKEIDKDEILDISVKDFKFTGLMNRDFIKMCIDELYNKESK